MKKEKTASKAKLNGKQLMALFLAALMVVGAASTIITVIAAMF